MTATCYFPRKRAQLSFFMTATCYFPRKRAQLHLTGQRSSTQKRTQKFLNGISPMEIGTFSG